MATASSIIEYETNRLDNKKKSVEDILTSKERMIQLNKNYIQRKEQYQKMLIAVIIGLAVYIGIYLIGQFIPIPDVIFSLVLIITTVVVGIYCFTIYVIIVNRDPTDFDKIIKRPPTTLSPDEITKAKDQNLAGSSSGDSDLLGNLNMGICSGSACCSTGTKWNVEKQLCEETFQTMNNQPKFKVVNQKVNMKSFTPTEFDNYSMY